MNLRLVNCSVVDALDERPRPDAEVQVRGDRIAWAGAASAAPDFPEARRLNLDGGFVLPGLVDSHSHLFFLEPRHPKAQNVAAHTMYCARQAVNALKGGLVGLRCVAEDSSVDVALRDEFNAGFLVWLGLWFSGSALTPSTATFVVPAEF